jgi:hypothetical protein
MDAGWVAAAAACVPARHYPYTCSRLQALLYLMGIPSAVPFLEVVAYAGYPFVHVCLSSLVGAAFGEHAIHCRHVMTAPRLAACAVTMLKGSVICPIICQLARQVHVAACAAGRVAWHVLWVYGALCMAVFTVRTIKRVIFHEARQYREFMQS